MCITEKTSETFWSGVGARTQSPEFQTRALAEYLAAEEREICGNRLSHGQRVLELGSGKGRFLKMLRDCGLGLDITGVDFSKKLVDETRPLFEKDGIHIEHASAYDLPGGWKDSFDAVLMTWNTLGTVLEPESAVREASRVLKTGGLFIATVFAKNAEHVQRQLYAHSGQQVKEWREDRAVFEGGAVSQRFSKSMLQKICGKFFDDVFVQSLTDETMVAVGIAGKTICASES